MLSPEPGTHEARILGAPGKAFAFFVVGAVSEYSGTEGPDSRPRLSEPLSDPATQLTSLSFLMFSFATWTLMIPMRVKEELK